MFNNTSFLSRWDSILDKKNVIRFSLIWIVLSLVIFLSFGTSMEGTGRPDWYRAVTAYPIQNIPVILASILCFRNGLSRRMPSGSKVWLLIGMALLCYFIGNMFFSSWELVWQLSSTGSLGDPFFVLFYVFLAAAMIVAITSKRSNLNIYQWFLVGIIGVYAASLATLIQTPAVVATAIEPTAVVQVSADDNSAAATTNAAANVEQAEPEVPPVSIPNWVTAADTFLKPYGKTMNMFYVWCDVGLSCLAVVMLLGCWGGKLSKSWRVNAQAVICIYVADMWYAYAGNQIPNYQSGFFLEAFWLIGSLQFGIAAAMEFDMAVSRRGQAIPYQNTI
jgi:hypothetical protein